MDSPLSAFVATGEDLDPLRFIRDELSENVEYFAADNGDLHGRYTAYQVFQNDSDQISGRVTNVTKERRAIATCHG